MCFAYEFHILLFYNLEVELKIHYPIYYFLFPLISHKLHSFNNIENRRRKQ